MLNTSNRDYQEFGELLKNKEHIEFLKIMTPQTKKFINTQMKWLENYDKQAWNFVKWVNELSFYMLPNIDEGGFILVKKDLQAAISVAYCQTIPIVRQHFPNQERFNIELRSILSYKKGEGYKLMKKLIQLGNRMKVPIDLWAETDELVRYYERYGFTNYGKVGENHENLMILFPGEGKY